MTLKERIARAIDPIAWEDGPGGMPTAEAKAAWEFERAVSLTQAQAALEAMLEPSEGMIDAFETEAARWASYDHEPYFSCNGTVPTWQAAIKAAIAER